MHKIITEAIICCPVCGSKYKQKMPQVSKHINTKCVFCQTIFGIKTVNDCCVYCAYSNVLCIEKQKNKEKI